jgi:hypothetical protein
LGKFPLLGKWQRSALFNYRFQIGLTSFFSSI